MKVGRAQGAGTHHWKFFRSGGVNQVVLQDGEDVRNLPKLDLKLWMALSMPVKGVELDPRTCALLDADGDGNVRPKELLQAVEFVCASLDDPGIVLSGGDGLELAAIADPRVRSCAERLLDKRGGTGRATITTADLADAERVFKDDPFDGDGIVGPEATDDPALAKVIKDVIAAMGAENGPDGKSGIGPERLSAFVSQARACLDWFEAAKDGSPASPWGAERTEAAWKAYEAVRAKVDDYFARCRLAEFDPRAAGALNPDEAAFKALASGELHSASPEIAALPLAVAAGGRPLPLAGQVNPAWAEALADFARLCLQPALGSTPAALDEASWKKAEEALAPRAAWLAAKPASAAVALGGARLREILHGGLIDRVTELIERDIAAGPAREALADLERLAFYKRDLGAILRNYVNFADFYGTSQGVFQTGTLYLDARASRLCLDVADEGRHAALSAGSGAFLVYCDLSRPGGERKKIVSFITDGDADSVVTGRNGVFIDRAGRDWNATVAKVVLNPVSVKQAFWLPYKKFFRMVEEQIAKRAKAADEASTAKLEGAAGAVATVDKAAVRPEQAAPAKKLDLGTIALIGTAIGGVSALVAGLMQSLFGLGLWLPVALVCVIALISGPSMILASMKLRKRNIGPLLEANGWAINTRALVNIPFGATMTSIASLPPGSLPLAADPFAQRKKPWKAVIVLLAITGLIALGIAWGLGAFDAFLPEALSFGAVAERLKSVKPPELKGILPSPAPKE